MSCKKATKGINNDIAVNGGCNIPSDDVKKKYLDHYMNDTMDSLDMIEKSNWARSATGEIGWGDVTDEHGEIAEELADVIEFATNIRPPHTGYHYAANPTTAKNIISKAIRDRIGVLRDILPAIRDGLDGDAKLAKIRDMLSYPREIAEQNMPEVKKHYPKPTYKNYDPSVNRFFCDSGKNEKQKQEGRAQRAGKMQTAANNIFQHLTGINEQYPQVNSSRAFELLLAVRGVTYMIRDAESPEDGLRDAISSVSGYAKWSDLRTTDEEQALIQALRKTVVEIDEAFG